MSGRGFIAAEYDTICEFCGSIAECRPYGPNEEQICFACATSTPDAEETARKKMNLYIFGETD